FGSFLWDAGGFPATTRVLPATIGVLPAATRRLPLTVRVLPRQRPVFFRRPPVSSRRRRGGFLRGKAPPKAFWANGICMPLDNTHLNHLASRPCLFNRVLTRRASHYRPALQ